MLITDESVTSLLGLSLVTVPSSLTFISEHETTSQCMATCYKQNGDLLVGTSDGLDVLHRGGDKLSVCSLDVKLATSLVEHHQNVFILHRARDTCIAEMCSAGDITKRKELFQFPRTSNIVAVMAVSDRYVVVRNPDTNQLIIYDFTSQQTEKISSINLLGLQFGPDSNLLGVLDDKLQKYRIDNGKLFELWTCDDIEDGYSLCTDSDGLIYIAARLSKKIFVVSSQGAANNYSIIIKVHRMITTVADIKMLFILRKHSMSVKKYNIY
ncbi:hypothetical protein EB796_020296 [Bugula neritina]|uniref:Uncharacterized protein n=1 Tax=Bugula neritina TaxID=10212 RepID=A0A7J7J6V8_BUGNE|nr:hypothetical protein EB796_020296 [Bugula neritina]